VAKAKDRLDDQVQNISGRMDVLDAQLTLRRNALQAEFIAPPIKRCHASTARSTL
jgi:hypothetical protein